MVLEYHIPSDRRRKAMLGAPIIVLEYNFFKRTRRVFISDDK